MEVNVLIPSVVDDIDTLLWRLKKFTGVGVRLEGNKIILKGEQEKLLPAQNYALRFIGPESVQCMQVSPCCSSILHVTGFIRHFEDTFNVIIDVKDSQVVRLKGRKQDNERFQMVLKAIDAQCTVEKTVCMTLFKLSNLRLLCDKFKVAFDEVPAEPPIQMALLTYFSSLLDELAKMPSVAPPPVPFVEVYRNQPNGSPASKNMEKNKAGQSNRARRPSGTRKPAHQRKSKSADRENHHPTSDSPNGSGSLIQLRPVVIDGSNVAFAHGKQKEFSPQGIQLAVDFFLRRGHTDVVAVVPRHRQGRGGAMFERLERSGHLCYSPSRILDDLRQAADDDKIILQLAVERDAVVISNDQFRNYRDENEKFKDLIDNRLIQYTLALDTFLLAEDPHGAKGPKLSQLLRAENSTS